MTTSTPEELKIMQHSLGLTNGPKAYRNYFAAAPGHGDWETLRSLVDKGLMFGRPFVDEFDDAGPPTMRLFWVTDAGCALCGTTRAEAER